MQAVFLPGGHRKPTIAGQFLRSFTQARHPSLTSAAGDQIVFEQGKADVLLPGVNGFGCCRFEKSAYADQDAFTQTKDPRLDFRIAELGRAAQRKNKNWSRFPIQVAQQPRSGRRVAGRS
jgi:hypothetical protein